MTSKTSPGYNCEDEDGDFIISECRVLLDGTKYLRGGKDNEADVEQEGEHDLTEYDMLQDMEEEFQKHQVFTNSDRILKQMQKKAPSVKSIEIL